MEQAQDTMKIQMIDYGKERRRQSVTFKMSKSKFLLKYIEIRCHNFN